MLGTKIKIAKMIETYVEICKFQFEWIETLAAYMREKTGLEAVKEINSDLERISKDEGNKPVEEQSEIPQILNNLATLIYVTYQIQTWQITESYCDVLEYRESGKRPAVCQGKSTDLPALLAHMPRPCDSDVVQVVDIPIKRLGETAKRNMSSINLIDLFSGNHVIFKVLDAHWLIQNGWILPQDKESGI